MVFASLQTRFLRSPFLDNRSVDTLTVIALPGRARWRSRTADKQNLLANEVARGNSGKPSRRETNLETAPRCAGSLDQRQGDSVNRALLHIDTTGAKWIALSYIE